MLFYWGLRFSNCVAVLTLDFDTPVSWRFSNCVAVLTLDFDTPVSWPSLAPMSSNFPSASTRCLCFCFLSIESPVVLSLFTKLWIVYSELFHQAIYVEIFADSFQQIRIAHTCSSKVYCTMTHHTAHGHWEQMANGANNCCLLLTNHKQTPMHEPHCSPWNIIQSSGPQVNYFLSLQTESAIRHVDSSTKFVRASQQAALRSLWSAETWNGQQSQKTLCIFISKVCHFGVQMLS
jgi:hypothetical protein